MPEYGERHSTPALVILTHHPSQSVIPFITFHSFSTEVSAYEERFSYSSGP